MKINQHEQSPIAGRFLHHPGFTRSRAFTLIELLTVVSIIAVMLALSVPVMSALTKSSGRKTGISNVMNTLEQARALAIRDGKSTYIVFMTAANASDDYRYKAYAIFEDSAINSGTAASSQVQITKWNRLPTGVSFSNGTTDASNNPLNNVLSQATGSQTPVSVAFTPGGSSAVACPYLQFDETGAVQSPTTSGPFSLVLFEGEVSPAGAMTATSQTQNGQPVATEQVNIQKFTGRLKYVLQ